MNSTRPSPTSLHDLTAREAISLFKSRELSPVELVQDCLRRIDIINPLLNAFCYIDYEGAIAAARLSEKRWSNGKPTGLLDGVPVTIKDLTLTSGMPTRRGSATTSPDGPWNVDAPVTASMKEAGAVVLGKTTSPEFGWKGITDNPLHGITRNPWRADLTPGGSSGGAGVAAALNLGLLHQGSDAGGSIRIPASFTGTYGLKPTFGYVAQWPASAMTILSHLGPMTRTVSDAELMMEVITRADSRDGYAGPKFPTPDQGRPHTLKGLRIAFSRDLGYVKVADDIAKITDAAIEKVRALGADVIDVDPGFSDPIEALEVLWCAGAARILRGLTDQQKTVLDPGFRELAERGLALTLAEYQHAESVRVELTAKMAEFHERYDFLVTPTMPVAPFAAGQNVPDASYKQWFDWTPFTYPFNMTQQPAASIPSGLDDAGLPVGLQIVGPKYADREVLSLSQSLEDALGLLRPSVANIGA